MEGSLFSDSVALVWNAFKTCEQKPSLPENLILDEILLGAL